MTKLDRFLEVPLLFNGPLCWFRCTLIALINAILCHAQYGNALGVITRFALQDCVLITYTIADDAVKQLDCEAVEYPFGQETQGVVLPRLSQTVALLCCATVSRTVWQYRIATGLTRIAPKLHPLHHCAESLLPSQLKAICVANQR